jgi:uncharacterized protein YcgL (UPF0745 family)
VNPIKKHQDDIFVDGGDDYSYVPEENNLIDDLLNENIVRLVSLRSKRKLKIKSKSRFK